LCFWSKQDKQHVFVEMPTGRYLGTLHTAAGTLGPQAKYWMGDSEYAPNGLSLFRRGNQTPLVTLGIDVRANAVVNQFNPAGTHFAWGSVDGSVAVCDIAEVQRRLASVGL